MNKDTQSSGSIIAWIIGIVFVIWLIADERKARYKLQEYNRTVDDRFVPSDECLECIRQYMNNKREFEIQMLEEEAMENELNRDPRY